MTLYISYDQFKAIYLQRIGERYPRRVARQTDDKCQLRYISFNQELGKLLDITVKDNALDDLYGRFVEISAQPIHTVPPEAFLERLCRPGQGLIVSVGGTDRVWNHGTPVPANPQFFWPFAVVEERCVVEPGGRRFRKNKEDVAAWLCAQLEIGTHNLDGIYQGIVTNSLQVIAIIGGIYGVRVLIRLDAQSYAEWSAGCRTLKRTLTNLGIENPRIQLRVWSHIPPDLTHQKLVYLGRPDL